MICNCFLTVYLPAVQRADSNEGGTSALPGALCVSGNQGARIWPAACPCLCCDDGSFLWTAFMWWGGIGGILRFAGMLPVRRDMYGCVSLLSYPANGYVPENLRFPGTTRCRAMQSKRTEVLRKLAFSDFCSFWLRTARRIRVTSFPCLDFLLALLEYLL